jgi:hypothetical protein
MQMGIPDRSKMKAPIENDFNALHPRYSAGSSRGGQFMPRGSKDQIEAIAKNTGQSVEEVAAAVSGKASTKKCASFTNEEVKILKQIVRDRKNGYLNENILERAIKAIADDKADGVMEWLIPFLILIFLSIGFWKTLTPKTQVLSKFPEINTSKIKGLKPNLVYTDNRRHLHDRPEKGFIDITLMSNGSVNNVEIPSPCDGIIVDSVEDPKGYGYTIAIDCSKKRWFIGHLLKKGLPVGTKVQEGETIAIQGSSGKSTGPHMHIEISKAGQDGCIADRTITDPLLDEYIEKIK